RQIDALRSPGQGDVSFLSGSAFMLETRRRHDRRRLHGAHEPTQGELRLADVWRVGTIRVSARRRSGSAGGGGKRAGRGEVEVVLAGGHPLLSCDEREAVPQLQEHTFELAQNGALEVALAERTLDAKQNAQVRVRSGIKFPSRSLVIRAVILRRSVRTFQRSIRHISA